MKLILKESQLEKVAEKFKPLLFKFWDKNGPLLTHKILKMFGLEMKMSYDLITYFKDYLIEWFGGFENFKNHVESVKKKIYHAIDGGYDFKFQIFNVDLVDEDSVYLQVQILPGGTVSLIFDENQPLLDLADAYVDEQIGWEIRDEVAEVIYQILYKEFFSNLSLEISDMDIDFK